MSTANNKSSARNSKLPTGMHNSASELMMKHARKEQMLVADVVRTLKYDYYRAKALSKERRTSCHLPTLNPRTMCLTWHLRDPTGNSLLLKKKSPKLNSSNIRDCDRSIMIPSTMKMITDSFKRMKSQSKLKSSRYWVIVTMMMTPSKKMSINPHILWAELSRRTLLALASISKPVMVATDT